MSLVTRHHVIPPVQGDAPPPFVRDPLTVKRVPPVFVHVGPMKSGTTYIQHMLADNHERLSHDGILYPPRTLQGLAVREVLDREAAETQRAEEGAWERLCALARSHEGSATVVSMEFLSFAGPRKARVIVDSLAPAEVHIVLTVRDAARVLPSFWANTTRNRKTVSWAEHAAIVLTRREDRSWRRAMRAINLPRMLGSWREVVPPERLHVVIVPPAGASHGILWERFASVLDIDPACYHPATGRRNESFGYASADLMRRVNDELTDLAVAAYQRTVRPLCWQVLDRRVGEPAVPMTPALRDFAADWNHVVADAVAASGGHVHGDLADLHAGVVQTVERLDPPPGDLLLAAAADALTGLRELARLRSFDAPEDRIDVETVPSRVSPRRWAAEGDSVTAAVTEVAVAFREAANSQRPSRVHESDMQ